MRSRLVTFLLIVAVIASSTVISGFSMYSRNSYAPNVNTAAVAEFPLNDVRGHWAEAAIAEMYAKGVMKGYADLSFRPKRPVTVLEAIVMIDRLLGYKPTASDIEADTYLRDIFQIDLPDWSLGYVELAVRQKLLSYDEIPEMSLHRPLTRREGAVLAVRALELTKLAITKKDTALSFTDADSIDKSSVGYIAVVLERSIMKGYPDNTFQPASPISRGEMAVLLSRIGEQIPYVNAKELRGFVNGVNPVKKEITLTVDSENGDKKELAFTLPGQYLLYIDSKPAEIKSLADGNYIRVISTPNLTVLLAQAVVPDTGSPVAFEPVIPTAEKEEVNQWVETNKATENCLAAVFDNNLYFLATRGEKKTSGFTIEIIKVTYTTDEDGIHYRVWLEYKDPGPNAIVNPRFDYPYTLVKVPLPDKAKGTITFVNKLNQEISKTEIPQ